MRDIRDIQTAPKAACDWGSPGDLPEMLAVASLNPREVLDLEGVRGFRQPDHSAQAGDSARWGTEYSCSMPGAW